MNEENKPVLGGNKIGVYRPGEVVLFGDTERLDVYYREGVGPGNPYRMVARAFAWKHQMVLTYERTDPRDWEGRGPMLWNVYLHPRVRRDDSEIPPQRNVNELFTTDEEWAVVAALSSDALAEKQWHWEPH